jgi:hypothetical protein
MPSVYGTVSTPHFVNSWPTFPPTIVTFLKHHSRMVLLCFLVVSLSEQLASSVRCIFLYDIIFPIVHIQSSEKWHFSIIIPR